MEEIWHQAEGRSAALSSWERPVGAVRGLATQRRDLSERIAEPGSPLAHDRRCPRDFGLEVSWDSGQRSAELTALAGKLHHRRIVVA
jgi:hypothetical protein